MVKTLYLTITILLTASVLVFSQGKKSVVVGTMVDRPNAILVMNPPNGDQGVLIPQLTTVQRLAINPSSPQEDGLMVFDVTEDSFYYWNTNAWNKGLGANDAQVISYDPATQKLTLSQNGGEVDLNSLKEIPSVTGNGGRVLSTDGTSLSWNVPADVTSVTTSTALSGGAVSGDVNLSVNTDGTTISVNGSNQLQLANGAVTSAKMATNAINSTHIVDGTITGTDVLDNSISTSDIADASMTSIKIANGSVNTIHITPGGTSKVLTTDATGVVTWADRSTFTDDNQNLSFVGSTLSIDDGTSVTLSAAGQVTGQLNNLVIQPGASNQVLTTNAAGTSSAWVSSGGDVTGPVNATTVARIQGRDVSNVVPNNGEALIWNGSAWVPTVVAVAPSTQYYSVDPSNFQALEPGGNNNSILGLYEADDTFVFAKGAAREIIAPLNLPHGATLQSFTVYYEYSLLLGPITINVFRKNLTGGGNQGIGTLVTPLIGVGVQSATAASVSVVDNSIYSYRVHVTFTNLLNVTDPALALQRIHGVRIQYTK